MFWVYMLRCADDSFYTGHTDALEHRMAEHSTGVFPGCYTYKRRPIHLVFQQGFDTREEALSAERQIKRWSRAKKQALVFHDWEEISRLAKCRNGG